MNCNFSFVEGTRFENPANDNFQRPKMEKFFKPKLENNFASTSTLRDKHDQIIKKHSNVVPDTLIETLCRTSQITNITNALHSNSKNVKRASCLIDNNKHHIPSKLLTNSKRLDSKIIEETEAGSSASDIGLSYKIKNHVSSISVAMQSEREPPLKKPVHFENWHLSVTEERKNIPSSNSGLIDARSPLHSNLRNVKTACCLVDNNEYHFPSKAPTNLKRLNSNFIQETEAASCASDIGLSSKLNNHVTSSSLDMKNKHEPPLKKPVHSKEWHLSVTERRDNIPKSSNSGLIDARSPLRSNMKNIKTASRLVDNEYHFPSKAPANLRSLNLNVIQETEATSFASDIGLSSKRKNHVTSSLDMQNKHEPLLKNL